MYSPYAWVVVVLAAVTLAAFLGVAPAPAQHAPCNPDVQTCL